MKPSILKTIFFILPLFYFVTVNAQSSQPTYSSDGMSGSLTLNPPDCENIGWAYEWAINVPVNIPIKITYTNYIGCYFTANIYENGTYYNLIGYDENKTISTSFVSKTGIIYIYCEDLNYVPIYNEPVFNVSFAVDNTYSSQENTYTKGNSIIDGKLGIGVQGPLSDKTLDVAGNARISASNKNQTLYLSNNNNSGTTYGLYNSATSTAASYSTYGIYSDSRNRSSSAGTVYGLYNYSSSFNSSSGNLYGIYSSVSGGKNRWSGYFYGGDLEVNAGRIITQPSGTSRDVGYNGQIMITKPAASAQYINLVRSGQHPWSIGTVYNTSKFAIGTGTTSESSFTNPFFVIDPSGNVGIGKTSPLSKLDISGDVTIPDGGRIGISLADAFQYDNKTMGHYSLGWFPDSQNSAGTTLWVSAYGGMKFFTAGTPRLTISTSGNVGIGTTNPQNALDVKGTIRATEVKVESVDNFADFVFNSGYKLPTLNEVQAYINENGHLKDIPSASEVKENGMSLTEMNVKLLQKVEELTLYAIQQQKQIIELQKQVDELKSGK